MNIQLFGTKKCKDTQKAQRFLKERSIAFHFRDILEKEISTGEWNKIFQQIPATDLMDSNSPSYKKRGLAYQVYDEKEELMSDANLIKTPILRIDQKFYSGFDIQEWKKLF